LVQQRLKQMMIRAIHERDAGVRLMKMFAEFQAAKSRAQHNDMFCFVHHEA
ncbi:MAG: hypothetical protein QOD03_704, partial [Verrucomicrobiota bacterium]